MDFLFFAVRSKTNTTNFTWSSKNFSFIFQYTDVSINPFYFELCIWTGKEHNCCWNVLHPRVQCTTSVTWLHQVFLKSQQKAHYWHSVIMFLKIKIHILAILLSFLVSSVGNLHSHTSDHDHFLPWPTSINQERKGFIHVNVPGTILNWPDTI